MESASDIDLMTFPRGRRMSVEKKRERILHVLASAYVHYQQWHEAQEKALEQLRSMSNLADQLAALRKCRELGRLGCLSWYPHLAELLEAKILSSFERALGFVYKHKETLAGLSNNLKCNWKESERLLTDILGVQGDERALLCNEESFSLTDTTEWLKLLNAAHVYDLSQKTSVLDGVACTPGAMERVLTIWNQSPTEELTEVIECVNYTVEQFHKMRNS